ncbi:MAG: hypothetical protein LBK58_09320 [Prevotellaceae bacterium]|jgi:trigger factor|nr:hypothetical protein [Prevotellaceae bacterium]
MELVQNKEGLVATLTVKISQEDYAAKVEKELKKARNSFQVKGFRPGHAPMSMLKRMYGQSVLMDEINSLLVKTIEDYEKENKEHLITHVIPTFDNHLPDIPDSQTDFEFEYLAGFFPEFTYQVNDTEINYYNILFDDTEVEKEIASLRNAFCTVESVEEIGEDCFVKVDIKLGEDRILQDKTILTSLIPDEHKPMFMGAKVNDVVDVEIRKAFTNKSDLTGLLEVSSEELDLLPETLPFTIVEISKNKPAELDQEFFDSISRKDSIHNEEEFREYIRKNITAQYEKLSLEKLYNDFNDILEEKANITLPEDFMEKYVRFAQKNNENENEDENEEEDSEESFESLMKVYIENTKWQYIEKSLIKQYDISITPQAILDKAKELVRERYGYGTIDNPAFDVYAKYYFESEENISYVIEQLKIQKLTELVRENAKLNVIDITADDFYELVKQKDTENQTQDDVLEIQEVQDVQEIQEIQDAQDIQEVKDVQEIQEQNNQE